MRDVFSHYVGIILLSLTFMLGFTFLYANTQISYAKSFHTAAVQRYSNSGLDKDVANNLSEDAAKEGWSLTFDNQEYFEDRSSAKVTLVYSVALPILNEHLTGKLVGFAH